MKYLALTSLLAITACGATQKATQIDPSLINSVVSNCNELHPEPKPAEDELRKAIHRVAPKFPTEAARQRLEGYVKMEFDIMPNGKPANIMILESYPEEMFVRSAVSALRKWKYTPATSDYISHCNTITLEFKLA